MEDALIEDETLINEEGLMEGALLLGLTDDLAGDLGSSPQHHPNSD